MVACDFHRKWHSGKVEYGSSFPPHCKSLSYVFKTNFIYRSSRKYKLGQKSGRAHSIFDCSRTTCLTYKLPTIHWLFSDNSDLQIRKLSHLNAKVQGRNPLRVAGGMLQVAISGCNLRRFRKFSAIVAKRKTELFFVQSLQAKTSNEISCEKACNTLQFTCDLSCSIIVTQAARKIASCNTCFTTKQTKKPIISGSLQVW